MMKHAKHSWIKPLLPHPVVSVLVCLAWLMLQHSLSIDQLLLAVLLGWLIAQLMRHFIVHTPNIDWRMAIKLTAIVIYDVIISNIRVAKVVLGPAHRMHPTWYRVPLATSHEQVNTLLAMIITTTPGTISAGIDQQRGDILVHSINTLDAEADIAEIKQRYEQALIQIYRLSVAATPEDKPC
jgi:multicomponent K+:H+ antiporter subunit E